MGSQTELHLLDNNYDGKYPISEKMSHIRKNGVIGLDWSLIEFTFEVYIIF